MVGRLIVVASALALGACETDPQFGETVHNNIEVAAIAPLATTVTEGDSLGGGRRAAAAQERYESGQSLDLMKPVQTVFLPGSGRAEKAEKAGATVTATPK